MNRFILLSFFIASVALSYGQGKDSLPRLTQLSIEELMNIKVVTASGFQQSASDAPSTIAVITARQIEERGYEQLEDALRDIPGIDFVHLNGFAPTIIYFRGLYGVENLRALLMIDGIAENNIFGSNDIGGPAYSLHNIERIEVIWGPASALYGDNAFGGVINMITKKGADVNGLHVQKGLGTQNTSFEKALFGIKKGRFDIVFSGSVYRTDGPVFSNRDPNYSNSFVDNAWGFYSILSYSYKRLKTTAGFRAFDTPMGWGTLLNSPTKFLGLPSQGYMNEGTVGVLSSSFMGERPGVEEPYANTAYLQNDYKVNNRLSLSSRIEHRVTGIGDRSYVYITTDGIKLTRFITTQYSTRAKFDLSANYNLGDKHTISAGFQFYQDNLENGSRKINMDNTVYIVNGHFLVSGLYSTFQPRTHKIWDNTASYLQYALNTSLLGKTNFTLGARYENNSFYGTNFSPRMAIVNRPDDKVTIKLLYGQAYRSPTISENNAAVAATHTNLVPEKITTYEANLIYQPTSRLLFQVNGFYNKMSDIILQTSLGETGLQNTNSGKADIDGIEWKTDIRISNSLSTFANFTWQNGNQTSMGTKTNPGKDSSFLMPNVARVKGNIGFTAQVAEIGNLSIIGNWVGQRKVLSTNPYGDVPGYFLTNLVITSKQLFNNYVTVSLNIRNIFNETFLDPGLRAGDGAIFPTVLEQPGRTGVFKIEVKL